MMVDAQTDADRESTAHDAEYECQGGRYHEGMPQIQLFDPARFAAHKNYIHREANSNSLILGAALRGLDVNQVKLCRIRSAETRKTARFSHTNSSRQLRTE